MARGLVEAMRARFEAVDLEVAVEGDARVVGVAHGIDTTLRNLIENAASFAAPQGDAPARVLVEVIGGEAQVTARVTDSGPGIPREDIDRVFTRFFTTRGRARGTGLGLALVRATAEAHGGAVRVTSSRARRDLRGRPAADASGLCHSRTSFDQGRQAGAAATARERTSLATTSFDARRNLDVDARIWLVAWCRQGPGPLLALPCGRGCCWTKPLTRQFVAT